LFISSKGVNDWVETLVDDADEDGMDEDILEPSSTYRKGEGMSVEESSVAMKAFEALLLL
jgi:hypothetical protein